jgi:signal peptidase
MFLSNAKKVWHIISSILFYSVMTLVVIIALMFLVSFVDQKIGQSKGEIRNPLFSAYIIISESMVPNINVYDAVVTVRVGEDKIKVDDIITFISKEIQTAGTPITHRVIGIVETETGIKYRTKGDHNNTADFALIAPEEVIGKVYLRIPMIGYVQTFMTKPLGCILIIVIPCLLIIGSDVVKLVKNGGKKEEETVTEQENKKDL